MQFLPMDGHNSYNIAYTILNFFENIDIPIKDCHGQSYASILVFRQEVKKNVNLQFLSHVPNGYFHITETLISIATDIHQSEETRNEVQSLVNKIVKLETTLLMTIWNDSTCITFLKDNQRLQLNGKETFLVDSVPRN